MSFSIHEIQNALEQCNFVATNTVNKLRASGCDVREERGILLSSRLGVVRRDQFGTYVIFRGTETLGIGTWLVTNFQAASTPFRVVDNDIHDLTTPMPMVQGCPWKEVMPGRIHQGIFRTWSQLWYGTDCLDTTFFLQMSGRRVLARYAVIGAPAFCIAWFLNLSLIIAGILAMLAILFCIAIESGRVERLMHRPCHSKDAPILKALEACPSSQPIWFVGHSLGGSLATLAFCAYRSRCKALGKNCDARLITFGSPLIGTEQFVNSFEQQSKDAYVHIANSSDPVTFSPPPKWASLYASGHKLIGLWGILLLFASFIWLTIYSTLWQGQARYAAWSSGAGILRLSERSNRITLFSHTRASYTRLINSLVAAISKQKNTHS
ncbi:MAG: hypothetical protein AB1807_02575 [Pseudomonadota bacterium]